MSSGRRWSVFAASNSGTRVEINNDDCLLQYIWAVVRVGNLLIARLYDKTGPVGAGVEHNISFLRRPVVGSVSALGRNRPL